VRRWRPSVARFWVERQGAGHFVPSVSDTLKSDGEWYGANKMYIAT